MTQHQREADGVGIGAPRPFPWPVLRFDQTRSGHAQRGVDLLRPDFALLGASFGITCAVAALDDLEPALDDAPASGEPRLVVLNHRFDPPRTVSARWSD